MQPQGISTPDPNSMLVWWPLVKDLAVPMPKTIIVPGRYDELSAVLDGQMFPVRFAADLRAAADQIGFPLFMRTDLSSGKHQYRDTCYVNDLSLILVNLVNLIEANALADVMGLPFEAIVLREFIPLASRFAAFADALPIAPERRYFVRDGHVVCHHAYWPEQAIAQACGCGGDPCPALPRYWRETLAELNAESGQEVSLLSDHACLIGNALPGYWSVDFALAADGRWIFIDAARGWRSWHPALCPFSKAAVS